MTKKKLAVIGASHFQLPLIQKAQSMGCEVHAFAWKANDVGERAADVFHPISITEVDDIVRECREVGVQGICSIASDLAMVSVCHVADALGLVANPLDCMHVSTNKREMRRAFAAGGDPSPKSLSVALAKSDASGAAGDLTLTQEEGDTFDPLSHGLSYPLIVKPADRSGSRGVTKLEGPGAPVSAGEALGAALSQSFSGQAMVEEYAEGDEFSVEGMSWEGSHQILTITRKGTTGAPHFIETAHLQPAGLTPEIADRVTHVASHALDTLGIRYGASHTELKIAPDGTIRLIEIGGRMGGDCIGSHLVELSTGVDFVRAVVDVALGNKPDLTPAHGPAAAASRFLFDEADLALCEQAQRECPELVRYTYLEPSAGAHGVTDSSTRLGHFVMASESPSDLVPYLPEPLAVVANSLVL